MGELITVVVGLTMVVASSGLLIFGAVLTLVAEVRKLSAVNPQVLMARKEHNEALRRSAESQEYLGRKIEEYVEHQWHRVH